MDRVVVDGRVDAPYARHAAIRRPAEATDHEVTVRADDDPVAIDHPASDDGPCAAEARIAAERCALAGRLRERLEAARAEHDAVQRAYDDLEVRRAGATATADERAIRRTKDAAQAEFRRARLAATGPEDVHAAAIAWLDEIAAVNARVVEARLELERARAESGRLVASLERLTSQTEALRIAEINAADACRTAQERLAACLAAHGEPAAAAVAAFEARRAAEAVAAAEAIPTADAAAAGAPAVPAAGTTTAAPPEAITAGPDAAAIAGAGHDGEPAVFALLRGDELTRRWLAESLGGGDEDAVGRWASRLAALADEIVDRAMEASRFEFPDDHPFWGWFSQAECRDIAVALASLGHRPDRTGAFADGHPPTRHDLSLAVSYAGQDPVRVRTWPSAESMGTLFAGTETNAAAFLAEEAGDLTLGEMVTLLGRHAERFTDLWLEWDRIRPLLLGPAA